MSNSRHTRRIYGPSAVLWAVAALLVAAPSAHAVDPAIKEYALDFPNAKGKSYPGAETPSVSPSELGPLVRQALGDRPDGKALATIATSAELGAPGTADSGFDSGSGEVGSGETPSVPTAVFSALGDPPVILGLLALFGVIAFLGFLVRLRQAGSEA